MNVPPGNVLRKLSVTCRLTVLTSALVWAAGATADYKLAAYQNAPGFKQIMASDYAAATKAAQRSVSGTSKFAATSNRCVALTRLGELDAALNSCNNALGEYRAYQAFSYLPGNHREEQALLLSNRGVVLALKGQMSEAEADFVAALRFNPENANAAENLEYVRSKLVGSR